MNSGKLYDVIFIRSFAIILVVFFHAYGMMYADHFPLSKDLYYNMYYNINQLILKFRMPLFVFISGYLFSYLQNYKGKYSEYGKFVYLKFKRLILPFIFFASIMMICNGDFDYRNLIYGSYLHLWFITMLFWSFVISYPLKYIKDKPILFVIIIMALFLILISNLSFPRFLGLHNVHKNIFWFVLGYFVLLHKCKLQYLINRYYVYILLFIVWILSTYYTVNYVKTDDVKTLIGEVGHFSIVILIWFALNQFLKNRTLNNIGFFEKLNKYSYGIYIFHNWIQPYIISRTAKNIFPMEDWALNYPILFPLSFALLSLVISYILSYLTLKSKIGKFLIG